MRWAMRWPGPFTALSRTENEFMQLRHVPDPTSSRSLRRVYTLPEADDEAAMLMTYPGSVLNEQSGITTTGGYTITDPVRRSISSASVRAMRLVEEETGDKTTILSVDSPTQPGHCRPRYSRRVTIASTAALVSTTTLAHERATLSTIRRKTRCSRCNAP